MHLANALGVPVIALFGPTNPVRTGPVFAAPHRDPAAAGLPARPAAARSPALHPATVVAAVQGLAIRAARCRQPLAPPMPLLTVTDLRTYFHTRNGVYRAVDGVSFSVERGETLGIVGESGSGKSVTCYSIMGLIPQPPGRIESGSAMFDGVDLLHCSPKVARSIRGKRVSMIFQDPMTSLNPYLRVSEQLIEPLLIHEEISKKEALAEALEMMEAVGINDAARRIHFYPHEFSGGMRQRVMIAMALVTRPELLIADEPTTALDVTVQAQILDLIRRLQRELGMAVIFVTHDLGVVAGLCDQVQVMYGGRIMETGRARGTLPHAAASLHPGPAALDPGAAAQGRGALHDPGPSPGRLEAHPGLRVRRRAAASPPTRASPRAPRSRRRPPATRTPASASATGEIKVETL